MCEFHDCNCNGFGDMWWTDKCTVLVVGPIDVLTVCEISMKLIYILRLETPLKITKIVCTNPRWLPRGGSN